MYRALSRLALAGALSAGVVGVCSRLPHLNDATAALLMVLCVLGISIKWGWAEALAAAIFGGGFFDYYFLGPPGFAITAPEYGVSLAAFLITATVTGQLVAQLRRRRIEAEQRTNEMEKLYRLSTAMLNGGGAQFSLSDLATQLAEIFEVDGTALYDQRTRRIVRSGPSSGIFTDQALRNTEARGRQFEAAGRTCFLAEIWHGGELVGSIGMSGTNLSAPTILSVAQRDGLGLARLHASERITEVEVLSRSEELKAALLDAMAHEIRNPLNTAKLAATTLLSGHAGTELNQREMLTIIDEELNRMDRVIDEAVQMARVEAHELCLKKKRQNLASVIAAAIDEMSGLAGQRPIHVLVPESLPAAECDKDMVVRVLKQLLSNALKYSPKDSPLTVSAEFTGEAVIIAVVDRGPGVSDEERDRIFEKYYRGRATRSNIRGTGLGLASARAIVQAHGGEIWMTSPPAGGAAFHVSLPVTTAGIGVGAS